MSHLPRVYCRRPHCVAAAWDGKFHPGRPRTRVSRLGRQRRQNAALRDNLTTVPGVGRLPMEGVGEPARVDLQELARDVEQPVRRLLPEAVWSTDIQVKFNLWCLVPGSPTTSPGPPDRSVREDPLAWRAVKVHPNEGPMVPTHHSCANSRTRKGAGSSGTGCRTEPSGLGSRWGDASG